MTFPEPVSPEPVFPPPPSQPPYLPPGGDSYPPPQQPPPPYPPNQPVQPPACYQHPDRVAGSVCRRCNRPICPDCMREAPVGWQCSSCVKQGGRVSPTIRWRPGQGGRLGNTRITPVVGVLIGICVVVYLIERTNYDSILERFALVPYEVHQGQYYRLITSAFLHLSPEHIALNMISLAIIGPPVEAEIGPTRFSALYLLSALGGSVFSYLLSSQYQYGAGASGAIFGVMGAYYVLARSRGWDTSTILGLVVLNLLYGFMVSGIDWRDHIGGLVTGVAVTAALAYGPSALRRRAPVVAAAVAFELAALAAVVVVLGLLVLLPPGHVNL